MKTAICYLSCHHGNTRKVVQAMAEAGGADLIDVRTRQVVRLEGLRPCGIRLRHLWL